MEVFFSTQRREGAKVRKEKEKEKIKKREKEKKRERDNFGLTKTSNSSSNFDMNQVTSLHCIAHPQQLVFLQDVSH